MAKLNTGADRNLSVSFAIKRVVRLLLESVFVRCGVTDYSRRITRAAAVNGDCLTWPIPVTVGR